MPGLLHTYVNMTTLQLIVDVVATAKACLAAAVGSNVVAVVGTLIRVVSGTG